MDALMFTAAQTADNPKALFSVRLTPERVRPPEKIQQPIGRIRKGRTRIL